MAARKNLTHDAKTRERIKTSQLINRLYDHIHGKVELSTSQVRGIEILLKKTLPDLSAVEMTGDTTTTYIVSAEPLSVEEWTKQYKPSGDHSQAPKRH